MSQDQKPPVTNSSSKPAGLSLSRLNQPCPPIPQDEVPTLEGPPLAFNPSAVQRHRPNVGLRRAPTTFTKDEEFSMAYSRDEKEGLWSESFEPSDLRTPPIPPTAPRQTLLLHKSPAKPRSKFIQVLDDFITQRFLEWWLLEILSWAVSAICMGALVVIFLKTDGKKIPQYRFGLTLNGLITILSGIARTALLLPTFEALGQLKWNWFRHDAQLGDFEVFDSASRGPWGAFLLLKRTKGRYLPSLGAIIVITSLPLSLFFQQIVNYHDKYVPIPGANGTLPRVITFGNSQLLISNNGSTQLTADTLMESTVLPFLWGNGTKVDFGVNCPTGNCTWEPYESLAICSKCSDVSELLTWACLPAPGDWMGNITIIPANSSSYPMINSCGYFLNATENPVLMNGYVDNPEGPGESLNMRMLPLNDIVTRQPYFGTGSIRFKEIRNPLADFLVVGTPGGRAAVYANHTPNANECIVHWCVKTFTPLYIGGDLQENPSNEFYDTGTPSVPWQYGVNSKGGRTTHYVANFSLTPPVQHPSKANITYGLSNLTHYEELLLFDSALPSYLTYDENSTILYRGLNRPGGPETREYSAEPWVQQNVSAHVENMTIAMSHSLRMNSNQTEYVNGSALVRETFVEVRWAWVTLPAILLFLSLVFLEATILQSSHEQKEVGIWKTSTLAVLLNGVDELTRIRIGPVRRMRDVQGAARRWRVNVIPD